MKINFQIEVDTDDATGDVLAVYFRIREGRVRKTSEFADGLAFADYDVNGRLLGIELLGPCRISIVDKIAAKEPLDIRKQTKRFMKNAGPPSMIAA